jgi:hypothetical protein
MATSDAVRTPEQAARQEARLRLDDILEEIAPLTTRTRRARDEVARLAGCDDLARLFGTAADRLEAAPQGAHAGRIFRRQPAEAVLGHA